MTPDQNKRREELFVFAVAKYAGVSMSSNDWFQAGYDAGFGDANESQKQVVIDSCGDTARVLLLNDELNRKLEMAKTALKKSIEFGEYADWHVEATPSVQQLDVDARAALKGLE